MKGLLLPVVAAILAAPASANIVTNPGFETGDFTGWTLVVDPSDAGFVVVDNLLPHSGDWNALFGNFNFVATLSQMLSTTPGATYSFSFWLLNEGAAPNSFSASWDGVDMASLVNVAAFAGYQQYSFTGLVASSASTEISFSFLHDPSFWDLDDVSVVLEVEPVPEPASVGLVCFGALALGLHARRRSRPV